jgi:hypothetical protein
MTCLLVPTGERRTKETFHQSEMKKVPILARKSHTGDSTQKAFGVNLVPRTSIHNCAIGSINSP